MATVNRLNPFEVREVLQGKGAFVESIGEVSIPLKSGRCCKDILETLEFQNSLNPFEVREVLQDFQRKL